MAEFTLQEAMVIHTALSGTRDAMLKNSARLIKEQGRDPYDSTKASVISAIAKIEKMANEGIESAKAELEKGSNHAAE